MATGDCHVLDVPHSDHEPTRAAVSAGGLGYSRHYAQRIRDLGRTSKDGWIKRLWNHMFGSSSAGNKKVIVKSEDTVHAGGSFTGRRSSDHVDHRSLPSDGLCHVHVTDNSKMSHVDVVAQRQTRSTQELAAGRSMPVQLLNSPYLPPSNKVVYYRPVLTAKPGGNARDGVMAAKLRYQRLSKSSTALRSSTMNHGAVNHGALSHVSMNHVDTSDETHKSCPVMSVKRQFKRDTATIQMEKRAKAVADRAIMVCINVSFAASQCAIALQWTVSEL